MIARIITCTVAASKVGEFRSLLNNTLLPKVQSQPGFVDNIEALDPNSGQFSCTTLWQNRLSGNCGEDESSPKWKPHRSNPPRRELLQT